MARPNRARSIQAERHLARRIAHERQARKMSIEGLAQRMSDEGCSINGSAVYRIESADPPRRITVDELVALTRVFGISLSDLLLPPEALVDRETKRAWQELTDAQNAHDEALIRVGNAQAALARHARRHPDAAEQIYTLLGDFIAKGGSLVMDVDGVQAQVAQFIPGREHEWQEWVAALEPEPEPKATSRRKKEVGG